MINRRKMGDLITGRRLPPEKAGQIGTWESYMTGGRDEPPPKTTENEDRLYQVKEQFQDFRQLNQWSQIMDIQEIKEMRVKIELLMSALETASLDEMLKTIDQLIEMAEKLERADKSDP